MILFFFFDVIIICLTQNCNLFFKIHSQTNINYRVMHR